MQEEHRTEEIERRISYLEATSLSEGDKNIAAAMGSGSG